MVLNSDNQWSYTWDNLSTSYTYSVMETSVPSGYKESCTREKDTIVLTNTGSDKYRVEKKDDELPIVVAGSRTFICGSCVVWLRTPF